MTLPFRRRHNDQEALHDRARVLVAMGFTEAVDPADAAWLEAHFAGCADCRIESEAWAADRELLVAARAQTIEPPRDLWARTAAAIEREAGRRTVGSRAGADRGAVAGAGSGRRAPGSVRGLRLGRAPLGALSGLLVVLVVVSVSLWPRNLLPHGTTAPGSNTAVGTPPVEATPIAVDADALAWVQAGPDGSYQFVQASLHEVCPPSGAGCAQLATQSATRLGITQAPSAAILSPGRNQLAVVTSNGASAGGDILIVPVPTPTSTEPSPTPPPSGVPPTVDPGATPTPTPGLTSTPDATPEPTPTASPAPETPAPTIDPNASPSPSPTEDPSAGHAIVSGVIVVGEVAYSSDGRWFAFAARPAGGEAGPDLYVWRVGDPLATAVTSDHRTFFSGWIGNLILVSRVIEADQLADASPAASPESTPEATPAPTAGPSPEPSVGPVEKHTTSFMLDPETGAMTLLRGTDVWHPTVDPTGRFVVYWSGTLVPDETDTVWHLGTGRLVIDRWIKDLPEPTTGPESPGPTDDSTGSPIAGVIGPAGEPVTISDAATPDFEAWFDPDGTRLAIWTADAGDPDVGTLRLIVLDPQTGAIDPTVDPLPGVAALRGVSINAGRLAWVTPPGQDGEGSHVQVLAWSGRDFGQVRTIGADRLHVVR